MRSRSYAILDKFILSKECILFILIFTFMLLFQTIFTQTQEREKLLNDNSVVTDLCGHDNSRKNTSKSFVACRYTPSTKWRRCRGSVFLLNLHCDKLFVFEFCEYRTFVNFLILVYFCIVIHVSILFGETTKQVKLG